MQRLGMQHLRRRWLPVLIAAVVLGGSLAWYRWPNTASAAEASLTAPVKQGDFKVAVMATGELRARKFVQVTGPSAAQSVNVYQTKIASIVPEGSVVKAGDVIAELDKQPVATRLSDVTLLLQKAQAEFTTAQLDSTLNLAQAREDVRTAEYVLEEKKILKEQAKYEAPTIRRQAEIDHEKAQRAWEQSKRNLSTKTKHCQDVFGWRRPGPSAEPAAEHPGRHGQLHRARPGAGHGHLCARVEREEEGRWITVDGVGADRRHAARPDADGVADLHQ
jgi:multidrug efflux pump subunit AcrA (membrane-fusion protein)